MKWKSIYRILRLSNFGFNEFLGNLFFNEKNSFHTSLLLPRGDPGTLCTARFNDKIVRDMTIWKWALCLVSETGTQTVGSHILSPGDLFEWKQGLPNLIWCEHFIYINTRTWGLFLNLEGDVCKCSPLMFDLVGPISPIPDCFSTGVSSSNQTRLSPFSTPIMAWQGLLKSKTTNKTTNSIHFFEDHPVVSTSQQVRLASQVPCLNIRRVFHLAAKLRSWVFLFSHKKRHKFWVFFYCFKD